MTAVRRVRRFTVQAEGLHDRCIVEGKQRRGLTRR